MLTNVTSFLIHDSLLGSLGYINFVHDSEDILNLLYRSSDNR